MVTRITDRKCELSSARPDKQFGSPFFLVTPNNTDYEHHYRGGDFFGGNPIDGEPEHRLIHAVNFFGQSYQDILLKTSVLPNERDAIRGVRRGDAGDVITKIMALDEPQFMSDAALKLAALYGRHEIVCALTDTEKFGLSSKSACDIVTWAIKGGSIHVVQNLEVKASEQNKSQLWDEAIENVTEDEMVSLCRKGYKKLFKYLLFDERVSLDLDSLMHQSRNRWAEVMIRARSNAQKTSRNRSP